MPHRRTFEDVQGWAFEVRGEVAARGQAIGLLEADVRRRLADEPPDRTMDT